MKLSTLLALGACAAALFLNSESAEAEYPDHTVNIYVGFNAGAGTDLTARLIAKELSAKWGQAVVVINKPGADGTIADAFVAHAAPDGYTLLVANQNHVVSQNLHKLDYDAQAAFTPISYVDEHTFALAVNPSYTKVNSLDDLIAMARANPGKLNFASTGFSSGVYLAMADLAQREKLNLVNINYSGGGPAMIGLLGGEVQLAFGSLPDLLPHLQKGELKALAVSSTNRDPRLPDVPTVGELLHLPDFNYGSWNGFLAPAGLSPELTRKLNNDIVTAAKTGDVSKILNSTGSNIVASTPEYFAKLIADSVVRYSALLKSMNVQAQ